MLLVQRSFFSNENQKFLYIVATPIGNLKEFSQRSIETLEQSELLICENKEICLKILRNFKISKKNLLTYSNISEKSEYLVDKILKKMMNFKKVSIVSCAGYPLVSDPGRIIVRKSIEKGFFVVPISGSSAFLNALVSSGFYFHNFLFLGFLPRTLKKQSKILSFYRENFLSALLIYESPPRLLKTLKNLRKFLGNRLIAVCREITKINEEFVRGEIDKVIRFYENIENFPKGEIVIVVSVEIVEENSVEKILKLKSLKSIKNKV